ncbi:long-chain fatty acid--CoA ligase [Salinisphaera orenii]|uniref:Long-chain fatty acid--CoA ligase n=1 Tax=Salinisphaera orenii YIM 95161 TaxID=1051139 RepID=A0A423Q442_9GAMM|nr:long-chain fatty acid--CoA ligase [Salinisphaera halophila]ROO33657.1 long-chain fatty acid--CoA ligase [Salinisphaera halophila YIM 95161]
MRSTMMDRPLLLDDILERAGAQFPDVEIVTNMPDKTLHRQTYGDMVRRAKQLAQALTQAGIKPGDRVATFSWNTHAHLEAYFGIPITGAVLHTLNLRLPPDDVSWIVNHAEDRILIIDDVLLPLYEKFADRVNFERIIVVPLAGKPIPEGMESYEDFLASAEGEFVYPDKDENDACGMCYTSGTTGKPKGVVYSHRSTVLHAMTAAMPDTLNLSFNDTVLPVVPMFHVNAWGIPYVATLTGAKQVYPGPHMDPESLLDVYAAERVNTTAGVPTIWMGILEALDAEPDRWALRDDLSMIVGGSAAPESMIRRFDGHGLTVIQAWGMTETSPLGSAARLKPAVTARSEDERYAKRATAGVAVPFVEVRIVGDDGNPQPWNGEDMGEIQIRGPWITGSYFRLDNSDEKFTTDGWLRTGDIATVDADGYIDITDRTKDVIKSGGEWISSVQLENAIMAHDAVAEAAVVAQPDDKWGERPLAAVVLRKGETLDADTLRAFLLERMAKWMVPDDYVFIDAIPRTSTGKFSKLDLRKQMLDTA